MQNRPTSKELIGAVATFIEQDVMSKLDGALKFQCLVALNALRIIERELELSPGLDAEEVSRIQQLLSGQDGTLDELNQALCAGIRNGDIAVNDPQLLDHLKQTTMGKASIDNPKYSGYRDAHKRAENE